MEEVELDRVRSPDLVENAHAHDYLGVRSEAVVSLDLRRVRGGDAALRRDPVMTAVPVSVVIPTMNEELNLPHVLEAIPRDIAELIIVDGRSVDATVEVAKALWPGVRIVSQSGKGKGNALNCGFMAARGDIVVMLDGDGSTDPAEIPRFVAALITGADFAKGTRFVTGGGSSDLTPVRRIGNKMLSGLVNTFWDTNYSDLCYGFNAFWRRCLPQILADCSGFEVETLMNIRLARSELKVVEVPSFEKNRLHGTSNLRAARDGMRVLRTIAAERVRPR
jgi:glycosyltransferase involved in cell wall biosynthesis